MNESEANIPFPEVDPSGQPVVIVPVDEVPAEEIEAKDPGQADVLDSDTDIPVTPDGLAIDPLATDDKFAQPGRVRRFATLLNLLNSVLGAGILGVPGSMKNAGIVPSCILIIVVGVLTEIGTVLTVKLQYRTKADGFDDLAMRILGKIGYVILSICLLLFCYSCQVAYIVIACDNLMSWFRLAGFVVSGLWPRALLVFIYSLVLPVALSLPRSIKFLSYFSLATVVCIVVYSIALIVKSIIQFATGSIAPGIVYFNFDISVFSSISVYALAFCFPAVVLPIIQPYNKDIHKRGVVTMWTMILCALFVLVPGVFGYLAKGDEAKDNILNAYDDNDIVFIIVRIGFFLVVTFSYPAVGQQTMSSWSQIMFKVNNHAELPTKRRALVLLVANAIPVILACFLPNIQPVLGIGGALGGCMVSFVFPATMWAKLSKKPLTTPRNVAVIAFAALGIVLAVISTYHAIVDCIAAFK